MKKPKFNVAKSISDLALEPAGFAHALDLLLLAIRKTNPAVGGLLDEFTAMHADYLAELQALARGSEEYIRVMEDFSQAAKLIYKRLSAIDTEQSRVMRAGQHNLTSSLSIH